MSNPSPPENWSLTYEASPAAGETVNQGDDWFRQLKLDVRERLEVEHQFGSVNGDDNGLHRVGSARCFVQETAPTVIEVVDHDNTGGAGTATLSVNASNSSPAETVGLGRIWCTPDGSVYIYTAAGWVTGTVMPRGHIAGLGVTVVNSNDDVTIAVGEARTGLSSSRSMRNAVLSTALTKQLDATWAVGNDAGGLDAGAVTANQWYHLFLIVSPTGVVDAGFSLNQEATTLLSNAAVIAAGFTAGNTTYRRIASFLTDGSSNILPVIQHGDLFVWKAPLGLSSLLNHNYSGADGTLSIIGAPPGVKSIAHIRLSTQDSETDTTLLVRPAGTTIGANPSLTASPLSQLRGTLDQSMRLNLLTESGVVVVRSSDTSADYYWQVDSYEDARGRWD